MLGDGPDDAALGEAWGRFCAALRDAGGQAFKDLNPASGLHRADALRFLTQNLGQAFDLALETRDPRFPHLHAFCTPFRKLGSDAADFTYQQAWIDGAHAYRIYGTKGTARFFNLTVQGARPATIPGTGWPSLHEPFGDLPEANLFGHQIAADADGGFELFVGGPERAGNWVPTTPQSRKLFVRQGFDSWDETPWSLRIERVDGPEPRPPATPAEMIAAIEWASAFLTGVMRDWPDHPYRYSGGAVDPERVNAFPPAPGAEGDAKRGRAVANMVWRLAPDEAVIVAFAPPGEAFWMASLGGVFMNSLDYYTRQTSLTPSRVRADGDGRVRLVLCGDDPGVHNWLDTCGFAQGNCAIRTLLSPAGPALETTLVRRADLDAALPPDTARVTPEERRQHLLERRHGIQRQRFGL